MKSILLFKISFSFPFKYIKNCLINNKKKLNENEKKILSIMKGNYFLLLNCNAEIINENI